MSKTLRLFLLLRLLVVTAAAVFTGLRSRADANVIADGAAWSSLPYKNEDQLIVSHTARAVIEMAHFASRRARLSADELALRSVRRLTPPGEPLQLELEIGSSPVVVRIDSYVWDPAAYVHLARAANVSGNGALVEDQMEVAAALLNRTGPELQAQNDSISRLLTADFRNPLHHETAAFVLTALAFREAAGVLDDSRLIMCRASAHLALARALRPEGELVSTTGRLADAMLQVLAGRAGPAWPLLDALDGDASPAVARAWVRAIRRRATLDWREPVDDDASLVERLEYMRALAISKSERAGFEYVKTQSPEAVPDWGWRTLDVARSVEAGHLMVHSTLVATLMEADAVLHIWPDGNRRVALTGALTREPAVSSISGGAVRVIDNGLWSAFYQRELVHVAHRGVEFYRVMLGSSGAAARFEAEMDGMLRDLPLWLLVQPIYAATPTEYANAMTRVVPLLRERPDQVPYIAWHRALAERPDGAPAVNAPVVSSWFQTLYPTGTTFDSSRLSMHRLMMPHDFVVHADSLHQLAPWDVVITHSWSTIQCNKGCAPEVQEEHFRLVRDYSTYTMRLLAHGGPDPARRLQQLCDVNAEDCHLLGEWLVVEDRFADAARAYERYIDAVQDRVHMSNRVEWLVRHYQSAGRPRDARRVAEQAADVGSAAGWRALAGYLERSGNDDRAVELYRRIYDRYDDGTDLLAYFIRKANTAQDRPEYVTLAGRYFGGSLRRFTPTEERPTHGLIISRDTKWTKRAGLRQNDIVVAMDGYVVQTRDQYSVLYLSSMDAPLRLTIWRDGKYVDVEAPFRRYYRGFDFKPYAVPQRVAD